MYKIPFTLKHFANAMRPILEDAYDEQDAYIGHLTRKIERAEERAADGGGNVETIGAMKRKLERVEYEQNVISNLMRCADRLNARIDSEELENVALLKPHEILPTGSGREPDAIDDYLDYVAFVEDNARYYEGPDEL